MQISTDETKNTRQFRSRSSFNASRHNAARSENPFLITVGGVAGKVRLKMASSSDITAPIRNVLRSAPPATASCESQWNTKLITSPATIQPIVPHTRTNENCREGSASWRNEIELTRASVGMYEIR